MRKYKHCFANAAVKDSYLNTVILKYFFDDNVDLYKHDVNEDDLNENHHLEIARFVCSDWIYQGLFAFAIKP